MLDYRFFLFAEKTFIMIKNGPKGNMVFLAKNKYIENMHKYEKIYFLQIWINLQYFYIGRFYGKQSKRVPKKIGSSLVYAIRPTCIIGLVLLGSAGVHIKVNLGANALIFVLLSDICWH